MGTNGDTELAWTGKIEHGRNTEAPPQICYWVGFGDNIDGVHGFGPDYEFAMKDFALKFNLQDRFKIVDTRTAVEAMKDLNQVLNDVEKKIGMG